MNQTSKGWITTCMVHTQLFPKCNQVTCCPFLGELQVCTTMQHHSFRTTISAGSVLSSCTAMIAVMCPFGLLPNIYLFFIFFRQNSHYHCHQHLHHHHQDCEHLIIITLIIAISVCLIMPYNPTTITTFRLQTRKRKSSESTHTHTYYQ